MSGIFRIISTVEELVEASQDRTARYLIIRNDLKDVPCIKLLPFQSLSGEFDGKTLSFTENSDGICLTKSNEIKNLKIVATPTKRAIFQDQEIDAIGNQLLSRINVTGQISFIFNNNIKKGRIEASFVHVEYASTNHLTERPNQYSVDMLQGAFTVWNKAENENQIVDIDITHFSCGNEVLPVNGSGLVLCGTNEVSGCVNSNIVSCGKIYTKGEIAKGTADIVCAGICIGYATTVQNITNYGSITCYGGNEMGLYNWGNINRCDITDKIETHGDNGCGIINAGNINKLTCTHNIETFGIGARGIYMFDGSLRDMHLRSVITHGDAASAIQLNRYVDRITISENIETFGNAINVIFADSFVKASADCLSIKLGGTVRLLKVSKNIISHGNDVRNIFVEGALERLFTAGVIKAEGENSVALEIDGGHLGAENINFMSDKYAALKLENAKLNNCANIQVHGKDFDILTDAVSSINRKIFSSATVEEAFQNGARIKYFEPAEPKKDEKKQENEEVKVTAKPKIENMNAEDSDGNEIKPMTCKPPKNVKPTKED